MLFCGFVGGFTVPFIIWHKKHNRYLEIKRELKIIERELESRKLARKNQFEEELKEYGKSLELQRAELLRQRREMDIEYRQTLSKYKDNYYKKKQEYQQILSKLAESYKERQYRTTQQIQELQDNYESIKQSRERALQLELKDLTDKVEYEHSTLRQTIIDNRQELSKRISDLTERIEQLNVQKNQIQSQVEHAEEIINRAEKLKSKISWHENIISTRQDEISQLEKQLNEIRKDIYETRAKSLQSLEDEKKDLVKQIEELKAEIEQLEKTARAIYNTIHGYGSEYIVPGRNLLDDLAEDVNHTFAGEKLAIARNMVKKMVSEGLAADCDYVEKVRRDTAIKFVTDAFNGKVDSILSQIKLDNYGILKQKIKDACEIVNLNGEAFRNARILPEYLLARLQELECGTIAFEIRMQEREEQRQIREQIREEEKARREYERAIKESAKEEETIKKAMQKAEEQLRIAASSNEAQKLKYEQQLNDLREKLLEAEEKNKRALSMAQQTKSGHVYIISNIGSFGENVYKIGMTRRLDPEERIYELGDASVPFPFDVHATIESGDAPQLETLLHKHFLFNLVNKVNFRKEFFRVNLEEIRKEIETLKENENLKIKNVHWTMTAAATQYRETLAIEQRIENDPQAKEAWVNRQLRIEMIFENDDD
jgi:hypothetical protein